MIDVISSVQKTLNSSSNRLTCPYCPKYKTKRYKGEEGLSDHIKAVHPVEASRLEIERRMDNPDIDTGVFHS